MFSVPRSSIDVNIRYVKQNKNVPKNELLDEINVR